MKKIYKSYKFLIYPTEEQKIFLFKHFGCTRFVYNYFLNKRKEEYLNNKQTLTYIDCAKDLTQLKKQKEYEWLNEISVMSLQQSLRDLDKAYNNFFRKETRFPKFKKKNISKQSFRIVDDFSIKNNLLCIPKFQKKNGIKINQNQEIKGKQLSITISQTPTNKYYVSISCEVDYEPYKSTNKSIGVDTGIKNLAILSDGKIYDNIRSLNQLQKKLKYNQRQLNKKIKGSNNRLDQKLKVARIYEKITHRRKDHLHKVSTEIIKNHDIICIETLDVKKMMNDSKFAKELSDVSLGMFYQYLQYKSEWNDRKLINIDKYFPSSKMCNKCKHINDLLTINDREWVCIKCNTKHDRDINAAINIHDQGLSLNKINCVSSMDSQSKQKQGEASTLVESENLDILEIE